MTAVPITEPLPPVTDTAAYFKELARRQAVHDAGEAWRLLPYPTPAVTSRDGVTPDAPAPAAQLQALAEGYGWTVIRQYSRGCLPHATTGKPGPARDMHTLLMAHPDGRRAVACYRAQSSGWAWESLWAWSPTRLHTPLRVLDDVKSWLGRGAANEDEKWARSIGPVYGLEALPSS